MRLVLDTRETINNVEKLSDQLLGLMVSNYVADEVVFVCIGTDRNVGDSLAPIVGTRLKNNPHYTIYGTIDAPVHALNVDYISEHLKINHPNALVIAIDAGLGKRENVGLIRIEHKPIFPGRGVGKKLPPIGDISIIGIVGRADLPNPYETLSQARLCDILVMSDTITRVVERAITEWEECK